MAIGTLKAHINIKPIKETEEGYLMVVVNKPGDKIRFSTKIRIPVINWNADKGEIKRSNLNFSSLNEQLRGIISQTEKAVLDLEREGKAVSTVTIKAIVFPTEGNANSSYEMLKELYISRKKVRAITLKAVQSSFSQLEQFAEANKRSLEPSQMDAFFFEDWQTYSNEVLGNSNAGYSKKVKDISAFLKWLFANGHTKNDQSKFAKRPSDSTEIYPLMEKELQVLENAYLKGEFQNQRGEVLKRFLFACYTGLRYGDLERIGKSHLQNGNLHFSTNKTSASVKIPLLSKAKVLISEVDDNLFFPQHITNQNYNRELKKIFELLKLNRPIEKATKKGAETIRTELKLSDKITSHDARRTFITLSLQKGMNHWQIMQITGHSDIEVFKKYVRFTDEQVADDLRRCWGN